MHVTTINKSMKLKDSKGEYMGGLGGRNAEGK